MTNDSGNSNQNGNKQNGNKNNHDDSITEPEHLRKLFIGGLDYRTTDDGLKSHFEQWGKIVDVVVMKDPRTKRSRGFGFITYSRAYMIDDAQNARPHKIDGRTVEPKRAVPRQDIDNPNAGATVKKLFVGGLRDEHDQNCLNEYFKDFGNITDINIVIDKETGKKRGFAFIEFDDYDPVDKVVLVKSHTIKNKQLDVKKALPKHDMDRQQQGGRGGVGGGGGRGGNNMGRGGNMGGNQNGGGGWGGNNRGNDNWGGNSNFGGGFNNGGGGGGWGGNNMGPWDNGNGGGNWNNGPGGNFGGPGGNFGGPGGNDNGGNWGGNDFGSGYQQNYGGGPQRGGGGNFGGGGRMAPYGNSGNFGNSKGPGGNFGGGNQGFNSGPGNMMAGGGNRRY